MENSKNVENIRTNIKSTLAKVKRLGTVAISLKTLYQITPTKGIDCPGQTYYDLFKRVALTFPEVYEVYND